MWNGWSIHPKVCLSDVCSSYKTKNDRENRRRGYEVQIEDPYLGVNMQRTRGNIQSNDQTHSQVGVEEAPNNTKQEYLQI